ncbi:hypothetical protein KY312_04300 [Candidatus Woesearchaeota archaeon]|nr:hypothetical protein [Candidatus Woesearchaeota archaeon]
MRKPRFPKDELAHKSIIEWWYFNGHLKDKKGRRYAFMNCLFKADAKKVNIPYLPKHGFKTIYFSHSILSDIKAKKFYPKIDYVVLVSDDSFKKKLLFVNYVNPVILKGYVNKIIEETDKQHYHMKTENMDLSFESVKKPLLEAGKGYVIFRTKSAYYYSLSNLKTQGTIKINNKEIKVKGRSWMDHQWANTSYSANDKWTWFSIQLDNNTEIVCFEFEDGYDRTWIATMSGRNNKQETAKDVVLVPSGINWKSQVTKAKYPLSWKIEIPSKKIQLDVKPLIKNQEMLFGAINYWEGPLDVKGTVNGKKVKGQGFLELVGYPKKVSNLRIVEKEMHRAISQAVKGLKSKVRSWRR